MKDKSNIGEIIAVFFLIVLITGVIFTAVNITNKKDKCPFTISKILTVSTAEGIQKGYEDGNLTLSLMQNNDIYVFIDNDTNEFERLTIENFEVLEGPKNAKIEMHLLDSADNNIGTIGFRQISKDIIEYVYTDTELVQDGKLLQMAGITEEMLKTIIKFDVIIETDIAKYKTTVTIEVPAKDLLEQGTGIAENTKLNNIVFNKI